VRRWCGRRRGDVGERKDDARSGGSLGSHLTAEVTKRPSRRGREGGCRERDWLREASERRADISRGRGGDGDCQQKSRVDPTLRFVPVQVQVQVAGCRRQAVVQVQVVVEVSQASCCVVFSSLPIEFRRRPGLCFRGGRQGRVMQLLQDEVVDEAPGFSACVRACVSVPGE
jgi:hypothetical protein